MPKRNERYFGFKAAGTCTRCGSKRADGTTYCARHLKMHRERMRPLMQEKRSADPVYRELERFAVRQRMRALRASRRGTLLNLPRSATSGDGQSTPGT
jgi:hypothetical protein